MSGHEDIFLVANLGSEVTRLLVAKRERDIERMRGAYERACGIVDELKVSTNIGGQSESAMLQTILDDLMKTNSAFSISTKSLQSYFLPFALKVLNI